MQDLSIDYEVQKTVFILLGELVCVLEGEQFVIAFIALLKVLLITIYKLLILFLTGVFYYRLKTFRA